MRDYTRMEARCELCHDMDDSNQALKAIYELMDRNFGRLPTWKIYEMIRDAHRDYVQSITDGSQPAVYAWALKSIRDHFELHVARKLRNLL